MIPPRKEYEMCKVDEFCTGYISDIIEEKDHLFKSVYGDSTAHGIQFKFILEGYKFPKKSKWMKFIYSSKSNLFKKFMVPLVDSCREYMEFDVNRLLGFKVKILWKFEDEDQRYQAIETIRPADGVKLPFVKGEMSEEEKIILVSKMPVYKLPEESEEKVPF